MKIVCDNCSTKYSIADEKVRGKVFKIKCKKCSHVIVVKGQDLEGGPAGFDQKETRVFDYSGFDGKEGSGAASPPPSADAVWHLVIDREQVGPLSVAEVQQKWASGEIDADTYAWREGFGDWQHLAAVDELAHVVQGARAGAASRTRDLAGLRDDVGASSPNMFAAGIQDSGPTGRADPTDLFAAAAAGDDEGAAELFSKPAGAGAGAAAEAGAGVYASSGGGSSSGGARARAAAKENLFASAGEDEAHGGGDGRGAPMTAQRNENSVLFSLNNLAAMATESNKTTTSSASTPNFGGGIGGSEGSGLIDIRAMAAMTLGSKGGRSEPGMHRPSGSTDDLPVFSGASFSSPAAGVLLPTGATGEGTSKVVYILVGLVGLLALSAIGLVLFIVLGQKKTEVVASNPPAATAVTDPGKPGGEPAKAPEATPGNPAAPPAAGAPPSPTAAPAVAPGKAPEKPEKATPEKPGRPERPTAATDRTPPRRPEATAAAPTREPSRPAATTPEPPSRPSAAQKCDEVACLVTPDLPCCPKKSAPAAAPVNSNLKDKLEQSDIITGMKNVGGKVAACNDEYKVPGQMKIKITINGEGQVTNSVSVGTFAGTPTGSCVERAVRGARFMKWKGPSLTFTYPYNFH